MRHIESTIRGRFPQARIAWREGPFGQELRVDEAKFPRVGRLFVFGLTDEVASIRHKWPGLGEFLFNSLTEWERHVARNCL